MREPGPEGRERDGGTGHRAAPKRPGWYRSGGAGSGLDQTGADSGAAPPPDSSACSFTDPAVSMELLRAVLQPSINEEIRGVFSKYMKVRAVGTGPAAPARRGLQGELRAQALVGGCREPGPPAAPALPGHPGSDPPLPPPLQFFQKAAVNVRDNVGEEVDPEQLIQETCRSCLEQVGACEGLRPLRRAWWSRAAWPGQVPSCSFAISWGGHLRPACGGCAQAEGTVGAGQLVLLPGHVTQPELPLRPSPGHCRGGRGEVGRDSFLSCLASVPRCGYAQTVLLHLAVCENIAQWEGKAER